MSGHHILKIFETHYENILTGDKTFEIRDNSDRGFQKGDTVSFIAIDMDTKKPYVEVEQDIYEITYVTNFQQKEDYVVFGIRKKR